MPWGVKGSFTVESALEFNLGTKLESNYKRQVERNGISKMIKQEVPVIFTPTETLILQPYAI